MNQTFENFIGGVMNVLIAVVSSCHKREGYFIHFIGLLFLLLFLFSFVSAQVSDTIHVEPNWNLLSLPLKVADGNKSVLYPTATTHAYIFLEEYLPKDTLENGMGFWLKFNSSETFVITGLAIHRDTFNVSEGWNMIGTLTAPIHVSTVASEPDEIIISDYYYYDTESGYQASNIIYPGLGYWVKVNQDGIIFLSSRIPCPGLPIVNYEGKSYNTVQIGDRCWLTENLDVGILVTNDQTDNDTIEKYYYNNDSLYGGYYSWSEAMKYGTTEGSRGICPDGWHIPTIVEFETLFKVVNNDGNALKAIGQGAGVGAGTNTSGYSGLLAGYRCNGYFDWVDDYGFLWSSTHGFYPWEAYSITLSTHYSNTYWSGMDTSWGINVRCIKGEGINVPPNQPSNPEPSDNSDSVNTDITLSWTCKHPEGDSLRFDVYLDTANPPLTIISSNQKERNLTLTNLDSSTIYYWRVIAKEEDDGQSTSGPIWKFTTAISMGYPCPGTTTVEYAGKVYNTIKIGLQCWLKENIDVGVMISGNLEQNDNHIIEKYCYNNDTINCDTYGGLYHWNEAMQYTTIEGARGICPPGWHIPTFAEFQTLAAMVGDDGNALKAIGQGEGNGEGTNTSGFSALLSGIRYYGGQFFSLNSVTDFWSSQRSECSGFGWGYCYYPLQLNSSTNYINLSYQPEEGRSLRCLMGGPPEQPTNTYPPNNAVFTDTSVTLSWTCSDPDGDPLLYDLYLGHDESLLTIASSSQSDTFFVLNSLEKEKTYYWKVVAKDNHSYEISGEVWRFAVISSRCPDSIEYFGRTYHTIEIANRCWFKENLNAGTIINGNSNQTDNHIIEKYCYDDDTVNCNTYGGLYQWNEAMQYKTTEGTWGICPLGWRIPIFDDFYQLKKAVNYDGNALKAVGQGAGDGAGTDTSGFTALLAGERNNTGVFNNMGNNAFFWSSSEESYDNAYLIYLYYTDSNIPYDVNFKTSGFSVRCIRSSMLR